MKKALFNGLLALSLFAAPLLRAEGGPQGMHHNPEKRLQRLTEKLKLTPEQQAQIKPILDDEKTKMEALMNQHKALREETNQKITAVLTDQQKTDYQRMMDEKKKQWDKKGKGKKDKHSDDSHHAH